MRGRGVAIKLHAYASTFDVHRTRRVAGSVPVTCVCSIGVQFGLGRKTKGLDARKAHKRVEDSLRHPAGTKSTCFFQVDETSTMRTVARTVSLTPFISLALLKTTPGRLHSSTTRRAFRAMTWPPNPRTHKIDFLDVEAAS